MGKKLNRKGLFLVWGPPRGSHRSQFLAQELGIEIEHVYVTQKRGRWSALVKYPLQTIKTLLVLARHRPRVIFIQDPPVFAILIVYLWGIVARTKYVIDSHTDALLAPWWAWSLPTHSFLSRRAITTIVTNDHLRQMVASWGAHAFVLTDVPVIAPERQQVYLDEDTFNVVVISTASYDEPVAQVLQAATQLSSVRFHVTGNYKERQNIVESAPDNVQFMGYLPDAKFYGLIEAAHAVMCLTTENHTIQSGAGEALWQGKPIITSDWPLLQEYFSQGTIHVDNTADSIYRAIITMRDEYPAFEDGIRVLQKERQHEWEDKVNNLMLRVEQAF